MISDFSMNRDKTKMTKGTPRSASEEKSIRIAPSNVQHGDIVIAEANAKSKSSSRQIEHRSANQNNAAAAAVAHRHNALGSAIDKSKISTDKTISSNSSKRRPHCDSSKVSESLGNENEATNASSIVNTTDMVYELLTNPSIQSNDEATSRQSSFPTTCTTSPSASLITMSSSSTTLNSYVTSSSSTHAHQDHHEERGVGHEKKMMHSSSSSSNMSSSSSSMRLRSTILVRLRHFCKVHCIPFRLWYTRKIKPFWKVTVAQLLCAVYILVLTFSHPPVGITDPISGNIIDPNSVENTKNGVIYLNGAYRPVVAIGTWQKVFLAISRISAFSMYPMLVIVFVTKMKALQSFFSKTPLSMYLGILNQAHDYHAHAGAYIAIDVWIHTVFHLLRWIAQGNVHLLWTSAAGLSGLITVVATPLITFPMMYFKETLRYEIRRGLHFLFYLFAVAMCFHVPPCAIPNGGFIAPILGACIVLYTLDACYVYLFMCEKIETTSFYVLSSGVRISMPVSERFLKQAAGRGGYAFINIPWINDKQWHAFSLFEDPSDSSIRQMFLLKNGDWTTAVHKALSRDTTRPCWIKGPFPSPYSQVSSYDNQILVASGIGITPALAAINAFKSSRRINLIWAVRDSAVLEFFLEHMYLDHDGWNLIFYTGKEPLTSAIESANTNVKIIRGRPNLSSVIPNVIYGIESNKGLPENYTMRSKNEMKKHLTTLIRELDVDQSISASEKVAKIRAYGQDLGVSLPEVIEEIHSTLDEIHHSRNTTFSATVLSSPSSILSNTERSRRCNLKVDKPQILSRVEGDQVGGLVKPTQRRSTVQWSTVRQVINTSDPNSLLKPAFCPWKKNVQQENFVKNLDKSIMSTWGIFFCGGSGGVISDLRGISFDYNIDLHIDSFAW